MISISWDQARKLACEILKTLPSPWTGYETREQLRPLIKWAVLLSGSPRTRESDAGALVIQMVYTKFAYELNWHVPILSKDEETKQHDGNGIKPPATILFFQDLLTCLEQRLVLSLPVLSSFGDNDDTSYAAQGSTWTVKLL